MRRILFFVLTICLSLPVAGANEEQVRSETDKAELSLEATTSVASQIRTKRRTPILLRDTLLAIAHCGVIELQGTSSHPPYRNYPIYLAKRCLLI